MMRFAIRFPARYPFMVLGILMLAAPGIPTYAAETTKTDTISKYHAYQLEADALYAKGDYQQAMKQYLALARKGDQFSQYRVSYMYLEGQGLQSDLIESFAWASLSAQNYVPALVHYRDAVGSLIPEDQHRKALRRVDYYMRKWGNRAIAEDVSKGARQEMRACTGSRLGARCTEVYAMEMPKFWGVNPGDGSNPGTYGLPGGNGEGDGGTVKPSGTFASPQGFKPGGPMRDIDHYQALRLKIREMNTFIEENNGSVTITDVATPEPESESKTEDRNR